MHFAVPILVHHFHTHCMLEWRSTWKLCVAMVSFCVVAGGICRPSDVKRTRIFSLCFVASSWTASTDPLSFTRKMLVTIFAKNCVQTIAVTCRHFVLEPLHNKANFVTQMTNLLLLEVEATRYSETWRILNQRCISFHGGLCVRRSRLAERHPCRRVLGKYTHDKLACSILKDCEMCFVNSLAISCPNLFNVISENDADYAGQLLA